LSKGYQFSDEKANSGDKRRHHLSPENLIIYLPAGCCGAGAGAGASAGFSGAGVAGASFVASGFGVSAGLQPTLNTANNINDNTNPRTFFIKFSPPSAILKYANKIVQHKSFVNLKNIRQKYYTALFPKSKIFFGAVCSNNCYDVFDRGSKKLFTLRIHLCYFV
jgi:hypothetical protein